MQICVLGSGLVGKAIVKDLAQESNFYITAVDISKENLEGVKAEQRVNCMQADLRESSRIMSLVEKCDLVVNAVPGFMGFETLRTIIEAGINVVDIAFFGEDPFLLDDLAKSKGVTAVVDCGVAPGLSNVIVGYLDMQLDRINRYVCYVGGLPKIRQWPYEYKAVFSPKDVLEEYTRPARYVEFGQKVIRPALSDIERLDFPGIGTLEAFNTDGLRSLAQTMDIPFMKEKTLRYPGHAELMRVFRESGFFSTKPVNINGQTIIPLEFSSELIFDQWKLKEGEEDITVMQVIIEGQKGNKQLRFTYDMLDTFDRNRKITSMARTTGYTCTIVARQVINGLFAQKGICPPEFIGRTEGCYQNIMDECEKRNIRMTETVVELEDAEGIKEH